jgi:hypothetical protein
MKRCHDEKKSQALAIKLSRERRAVKQIPRQEVNIRRRPRNRKSETTGYEEECCKEAHHKKAIGLNNEPILLRNEDLLVPAPGPRWPRQDLILCLGLRM